MTRDDLFKINAGIVKGLIEGVAQFCPKAFVLVISNPVNSTVPIAAEVLKAAGVFDAKKLFGVTTLDVVRAETFVASITGESNPSKLTIPVIGGHSGQTIVPLFSQAQPSVNIPADKLDALVNREYMYATRNLSMPNTTQVSSSVVTKSFKPRTVLVRPLCQWHTPVTGKSRVFLNWS
jgi:malate/lactate dehydrogenase